MAEPPKGIDTVDDSACFIFHEAECLDDTIDDLFEKSDEGSTVSNLIDDDFQEQGNSLALYNSEITEECNRAVLQLKRKYAKSPEGSPVLDLSPRLQAISISPQKEKQSKRRLFQDSGLGEDEAELFSVQVETQSAIEVENGAGTLTIECHELLRSRCKRSHLCSKFKNLYGVSFTELTRTFKSNKSCCENWIVFAFAATTEVLESSKVLLQPQCDCLQVLLTDFAGLYLLQFKHGKSRETVENLFCNILNVKDYQLLSNPPRSRSLPVALFFFKKSLQKSSYVFNTLPEWVIRQTALNHQAASQPETFELAKMVQWAYDNQITDESELAYQYASLADEDCNAAAFLKSNCQVRYVRDCCTMVKLYFRQEMRQMSMSAWIWKCCEECEEETDWKVIANFLKYQKVNIIEFLSALRLLFKRIPKKSCILIHGPPDTGKSFFCFSLIKFFKGKVISYVNKNSNFWLQPLLDCKLALLDDATFPCWQYIDLNMRGALDGNVMCIDAKHKNPQQIRLPPLLVTSNIDVPSEESLKYLKSRLMCFEFAQKLPFDEVGNPIFNFTDQVWKAFFKKLARQLDLEEENIQHESNRNERAFRCTAASPDADI
ncbi:E1 [Gammapapillomavirus 9]|uniref:Replication protein E1 n=1 Tax=Gammapapillomavirus 9 TaxID=1175851 RepID=A0A2D2ALH7_9PAPI|nr:E1 [Gammapapillomavirus 9]